MVNEAARQFPPKITVLKHTWIKMVESHYLEIDAPGNISNMQSRYWGP